MLKAIHEEGGEKRSEKGSRHSLVSGLVVPSEKAPRFRTYHSLKVAEAKMPFPYQGQTINLGSMP